MNWNRKFLRFVKLFSVLCLMGASPLRRSPIALNPQNELGTGINNPKLKPASGQSHNLHKTHNRRRRPRDAALKCDWELLDYSNTIIFYDRLFFDFFLGRLLSRSECHCARQISAKSVIYRPVSSPMGVNFLTLKLSKLPGPGWWTDESQTGTIPLRGWWFIVLFGSFRSDLWRWPLSNASSDVQTKTLFLNTILETAIRSLSSGGPPAHGRKNGTNWNLSEKSNHLYARPNPRSVDFWFNYKPIHKYTQILHAVVCTMDQGRKQNHPQHLAILPSTSSCDVSSTIFKSLQLVSRLSVGVENRRTFWRTHTTHKFAPTQKSKLSVTKR